MQGKHVEGQKHKGSYNDAISFLETFILTSSYFFTINFTRCSSIRNFNVHTLESIHHSLTIYDGIYIFSLLFNYSKSKLIGPFIQTSSSFCQHTKII